MKANIVQIGNSQGVRIPKVLLEQLKFERTVELEILPEGLLLRPVSGQTPPRTGWAEQFAVALAAGETDDAQEEEFADWDNAALSRFDEEEW